MTSALKAASWLLDRSMPFTVVQASPYVVVPRAVKGTLYDRRAAAAPCVQATVYDEHVDAWPDDEFDPVEARLEAEIARAIGAADDGTVSDDTAYRRVGRITEVLRSGMTASGDRRSVIADRIRQSGQLSLAALAGKIGVSKARAQEMVDRARGRRP